MFNTPLRNSKNVDKPFKSPFGTPSTLDKKIITKSGQKKIAKKRVSVSESPLWSTTFLTFNAKRTLKMDDDNDTLVEMEPKRPRLLLSVDTVDSEYIDMVPENATDNDFFALKRRVFEIRQELECFKSRERCTIKHDPKDLRTSIDKWKTACQNALEIVCSELIEKRMAKV